MCLLFVLQNQVEEFPLIMLFNRDEGFQKQTQPLGWWNYRNQGLKICGGRDLDKGGTWAGVNKSGRLAMITFVRKTREAITPSIARGEIVPRWLQGEDTVDEFVKRLRAESKLTLGYNLVFGDSGCLYHFENHSGKLTLLTERFHGISNAYLDTPGYKVIRGKLAIETTLIPKAQNQKLSIADLEQELFAVMEDDAKAGTEEVQVTGLSYFYEEERSSIFVRARDYGTISSAVLTVSSFGEFRFTERSYDQLGKCFNVSTESFFI